MHYADNYRELKAHMLVGSARQGFHTLPQAMLDDYDQLLQLIEDGTQRPGKWHNPKAEKDAEKLARKLIQLHNYGGNDGLIRDHIAPAIDAYIDGFKTDRATAGRHALAAAVGPHMLLEPLDVREALVRIHEAPIRYGQVRRMWALLRGVPNPHSIKDANTDPQAANSILGECRNIADLVPEWQNAGNGPGSTPWPWGNTSSAHIRLAWLIDHGGHIWAPTASEHNALYRKLREADLEARRGPGPRRPVGSSGTAAA